jgi:hypothetical protein
MEWQKLQKFVFIGFLVLIIGLFFLSKILGYDIDSESIRQYLKNFGLNVIRDIKVR